MEKKNTKEDLERAIRFILSEKNKYFIKKGKRK